MAEGRVPPIGVVIADDDKPFREVLRDLLDSEPDIEVLAEANDGRQALAVAQDLVPEVVLLDIRMPGEGGVAAAAAIKASLPHTLILMLTVSDEEDDVFNSLRAGASGYLRKDGDLTTVASAIRSVAAEQIVLSAVLWSKIFSRLEADSEPAPTPRQLDVLRLLNRDLRNREIAAQLVVSEHTVKRHVADILTKFHQCTRRDAVEFAREQGLLS